MFSPRSRAILFLASSPSQNIIKLDLWVIQYNTHDSPRQSKKVSIFNFFFFFFFFACFVFKSQFRKAQTFSRERSQITTAQHHAKTQQSINFHLESRPRRSAPMPADTAKVQPLLRGIPLQILRVPLRIKPLKQILPDCTVSLV